MNNRNYDSRLARRASVNLRINPCLSANYLNSNYDHLIGKVNENYTITGSWYPKPNIINIEYNKSYYKTQIYNFNIFQKFFNSKTLEILSCGDSNNFQNESILKKSNIGKSYTIHAPLNNADILDLDGQKHNNNIEDENNDNNNNNYVNQNNIHSNENNNNNFNHKANLNKNCTIISNLKQEIKNKNLLHITKTYSRIELNRRQTLNNSIQNNPNYCSDDENIYDNKSLNSENVSDSSILLSFNPFADKEYSNKNEVKNISKTTVTRNRKVLSNSPKKTDIVQNILINCVNDHDNLKKDYKKIDSYNRKIDENKSSTTTKIKGDKFISNNYSNNNNINCRQNNNPDISNNQIQNNLQLENAMSINSFNIDIGNDNSNLKLISNDKNHHDKNQNNLFENLNIKSSANKRNSLNNLLDEKYEKLRNLKEINENNMSKDHEINNINNKLDHKNKTKQIKRTSKNSLLKITSEKQSEKSNEKQKVFMLLGQYFIELNGDTKFFLVYYRKINNILDIIFHDCTKIVVAQTVSSENKIKHKLLSKIAHEFKTPLNNIIGITNNLKTTSVNKNFKIVRDLKLITSLSNYTIYLISDMIQYASNDSKNNNSISASFEPSSMLSFNNNDQINVSQGVNSNKIEDVFGEIIGSRSNLNLNSLRNNSASGPNSVCKPQKNNQNIIFRQVDINKSLVFCFDILNALLSCNEMKRIAICTELRIDERIRFASLVSDEVRINQILINFISNAIKFTKHGKILIIASLVEKNVSLIHKKNIRNTNISTYMNNNQNLNSSLEINNFNNENKNSDFLLKISVVDTGIGICNEKQKVLFNDKIALNTKHEFNHQGSSLGLSICLNLIKLLNIVVIEYCSKENLGSSFSLILPIKLQSESTHSNISEAYWKPQLSPNSSNYKKLENRSSSLTNKSYFANNFKINTNLNNKSSNNKNNLYSIYKDETKCNNQNSLNFKNSKQISASQNDSESEDQIQILQFEDNSNKSVSVQNLKNKIFSKNSFIKLKRRFSYDETNHQSKILSQIKIHFECFDYKSKGSAAIDDNLNNYVPIKYNFKRTYSIPEKNVYSNPYNDHNSVYNNTKTEGNFRYNYDIENKYRNINFQDRDYSVNNISMNNITINSISERNKINLNYLIEPKVTKFFTNLDRDSSKINNELLLQAEADEEKKHFEKNKETLIIEDNNTNNKLNNYSKAIDFNFNPIFTLAQKTNNNTNFSRDVQEMKTRNYNLHSNSFLNSYSNEDFEVLNKSFGSSRNSAKHLSGNLNINNNAVSNNDNGNSTDIISIVNNNNNNNKSNINKNRRSSRFNSTRETKTYFRNNKNQFDKPDSNAFSNDKRFEKTETRYLKNSQTMGNIGNSTILKNRLCSFPYNIYPKSRVKSQNTFVLENLNSVANEDLINNRKIKYSESSNNINNYDINASLYEEKDNIRLKPVSPSIYSANNNNKNNKSNNTENNNCNAYNINSLNNSNINSKANLKRKSSSIQSHNRQKIEREFKSTEIKQMKKYYNGKIINTFDYELINDLRQNKLDNKYSNYKIYYDDDIIYHDSMKSNTFSTNTVQNTVSNTLVGFNLNSNNNIYNKNLNSSSHITNNDYNSKSEYSNLTNIKSSSNLISNNWNNNPINKNNKYNKKNNLNLTGKKFDTNICSNIKTNTIESSEDEYSHEKKFSNSFSFNSVKRNSNLHSNKNKQELFRRLKTEQNDFQSFPLLYGYESPSSRIVFDSCNKETGKMRKNDNLNFVYTYPTKSNIYNKIKNSKCDVRNSVQVKKNNIDIEDLNLNFNNNNNVLARKNNFKDIATDFLCNNNRVNSLISIDLDSNNLFPINNNYDKFKEIRPAQTTEDKLYWFNPLVDNTEIYYNVRNNTNLTDNTNNSILSSNTLLDRGFKKIPDINNITNNDNNNNINGNDINQFINNNNNNFILNNPNLKNQTFNNSMNNTNGIYETKHKQNFQTHNSFNNNYNNNNQFHHNQIPNTIFKKSSNKSLFVDQKQSNELNPYNNNINHVETITNNNDIGGTQLNNITNDLKFPSNLNTKINFESVETQNFMNLLKKNSKNSTIFKNNQNIIDSKDHVVLADNLNSYIYCNKEKNLNELKDTQVDTIIKSPFRNFKINNNPLNFDKNNSKINQNLNQLSFDEEKNANNKGSFKQLSNNSGRSPKNNFPSETNYNINLNSYNDNNDINFKPDPKRSTRNKKFNMDENEILDKKIIYIHAHKKFDSFSLVIDKPMEFSLINQAIKHSSYKRKRKLSKTDKKSSLRKVDEMSDFKCSSEEKSYDSNEKVDLLELYYNKKKQYRLILNRNKSNMKLEDENKDESHRNPEAKKHKNRSRKDKEQNKENNQEHKAYLFINEQQENKQLQKMKMKTSTIEIKNYDSKLGNFTGYKKTKNTKKDSQDMNNYHNKNSNFKSSILNYRDNFKTKNNKEISDSTCLPIKTLNDQELREEKKQTEKIELINTPTINKKNRNKPKSTSSSSSSVYDFLSESNSNSIRFIYPNSNGNSNSSSRSKSQSKSRDKNQQQIKESRSLKEKKTSTSKRQEKIKNNNVNKINIYSNITCCCKNNTINNTVINTNNNNINNNVNNDDANNKANSINNNNVNINLNNNLNTNRRKSENPIENLDLDSNKLVILVIDDNYYIRKSIANLINNTLKSLRKTMNFSAEFEIIEGGDGIDALKSVIDPKIGSRIKALFIDENMEYLNGSETVRLVRNFQKLNKINKFNIVSVTAFEDPVTKQNVMNAGVNEIFSKPLTKSHLEDFFKRYNILL